MRVFLGTGGCVRGERMVRLQTLACRQHDLPRQPSPCSSAVRAPPPDAIGRTTETPLGPRALRACATSAPAPRSYLEAIRPATKSSASGSWLRRQKGLGRQGFFPLRVLDSAVGRGRGLLEFPTKSLRQDCF